jgi:vitamin B12 transporter
MSISCFGQRAPRVRRLSSFALSLFAVFSTAPLPASAQSSLEPVIVTGTREPQPLGNTTADVVVISAQTIRDTSADSVGDLLRREAGMQLTRSGGPGQSSGYFIRGANTNSTVVLIDGVRVGSASLGQAEFEALSLAQIDHIEVLRGPASSLYGADAVGGVVQIFTRRGDGAPRVTAGVAIGGYGSKQGDVGVSGSSGAFDYAVTGGREYSRGTSAIRPNDQFGNFNPDDDGYGLSFGNLKLGYSPAAGHRIGIDLIETKLNAQYDSCQFDPVTFDCPATPDFRNHLTTRLAALDYRGVVSNLWTTTVLVSQAVDNSYSGAPEALSHFRTNRDQASWQNALHFAPNQQLMLAYEYLHEQVDSDSFTDQRSNNAFVVGYSGRFGIQGIEASLRRDQNTVYGGNTTGSLGYSINVLPELKLRALAGTTFRAPTFNDLFFPFFGIPTIRPERGRSVELGAEWASGGTDASATVYRNRVKDLIGFDPDPNGTDCPAGFFGCAANTSRATLQGATFKAGQRWGAFNLHGTVDLLDAKDADTGVRLARRAAHQETLAVDYDAGPWSAGASVLDVGSRPDGGITLGGYAIVDLKAAWRFMPQWRLEAKLLNALDHRIEPIRDYQGLGRQAWIGVRYDGAGIR